MCYLDRDDDEHPIAEVVHVIREQIEAGVERRWRPPFADVTEIRDAAVTLEDTADVVLGVHVVFSLRHSAEQLLRERWPSSL